MNRPNKPNCKESPGGLRDLQAILWIAQAAGFGCTWKDLQLHGFITQQEALGLQRRELFLERLRIQLHIHVRRREDRLLFDHQRAIAEQMGFSDSPSLLASEQLMQEYYRTAKVITQLNTILLQNHFRGNLHHGDATMTQFQINKLPYDIL